MSHCTICPQHAISDATPVTGTHWNRERMTSRGKVIYFCWHFDELRQNHQAFLALNILRSF
jgi:hypothetical protein